MLLKEEGRLAWLTYRSLPEHSIGFRVCLGQREQNQRWHRRYYVYQKQANWRKWPLTTKYNNLGRHARYALTTRSSSFLLINEANCPSISSFGWNRFGSMIPFLIVSDTFAPETKDHFVSFDQKFPCLPIKIDPRISKIVARMHACRSVKTLLPTLVPKEFATSFAPMPKAKMKATMKPAIITHNNSTA